MAGQTPDEGAAGTEMVVRRAEHGWRVGNEEAADLTSAMVLADLLAADLGAPAPPPAGPPRSGPPRSGPPRSEPVSEADEAARLAVTVAQLEHALATRVRVEQAIGVLAERHRLRPRQAFDLLRNVARSGGGRVIEIAETVVESTSNPLLPLPEALARTQAAPPTRGRSPRHARRELRPLPLVAAHAWFCRCGRLGFWLAGVLACWGSGLLGFWLAGAATRLKVKFPACWPGVPGVREDRPTGLVAAGCLGWGG